MTFELWDTATGNVVDAFATLDAALAAVRAAVEAHGRAYGEELAVIRENGRGRSRLVVGGAELVERALGGAVASQAAQAATRADAVAP